MSRTARTTRQDGAGGPARRPADRPERPSRPSASGPREPDWTAPTERNVRAVYERLRRRYGPLDAPRRLDPLEELVLTVLSQNTNDRNRDRAYASMRARFRTWDDVASAREADLVDAIRVGGLANTKAPRIQAILRRIREREGGFNLSWMRRAPRPRVDAYLRSLPGVGPKTVACVLAFALGRDALPVDTHVHRVALRLRLLPPGIAPEPAHEEIERVVPRRLRVRMHVALIRLGRDVCRAGRPRCGDCALLDVCPTGPRVLAEMLG